MTRRRPAQATSGVASCAGGAFLVVDKKADWPLELPGVTVVSALEYLTEGGGLGERGTRVFNLCRSYRYQSFGYYVSLLAAARGHRPLPSVNTIQDLRHRSLLRLVSEDLDDSIQRGLAPLTTDRFVLSIYFGKNLAKRHERLALQLFNLFPAPLLRAHFRRHKKRWQLRSLSPIATREVPEEHREFLLESAHEYFQRKRMGRKKRSVGRFDLAILVNPDEREAPSDQKALQGFTRAGEELGFRVAMVGPDDYGRLAEFDALFIRETTRVDHHTFRFSARAAAEGLVVIDDPDSIIRCANKVFLAERLERGRVPQPRTRIVHEGNVDEVADSLGLPCILKLPDSSFSQGVVKVSSESEFRERASEYLRQSDLLIAQAFVPTDFDWRVGIIDRQVLYVCKYHMALSHWQVIRRDDSGRAVDDGPVDTYLPEEAPRRVVEVATRAARLIGDGLYGVDLKEVDGQPVVIEINDNPNIDHGNEDRRLGEELYRRVMQVFLDRVERIKNAGALSATNGTQAVERSRS